MTMAPPAANASCTGSEMGIWWKNASTSTQTGTSNRIRKTTGTLEQCGANAGLPIVHTAHFVLGGVFGNWAEAGISLRYDTNGGLYYRVFTEAGLGGNVTQVKGFGTPPCTRVVAAANNYVKLRVYYAAGPHFYEIDCEDGAGFRSLGNRGFVGGYSSGRAAAEYAVTWTLSNAAAYQTSLSARSSTGTWLGWNGSVCLRDNLTSHVGQSVSLTTWQKATGTGSC